MGAHNLVQKRRVGGLFPKSVFLRLIVLSEVLIVSHDSMMHRMSIRVMPICRLVCVPPPPVVLLTIQILNMRSLLLLHVPAALTIK